MAWLQTHGGKSNEDEGGSYLVSVSDMMCGLLFIFIITLMVFVLNFQEEKSKTENINKKLTDSRKAREELLQDLKDSLLKAGVQVHVDKDKGLLHIPEDVLFPSGKATIQDGGKRALKILAKHLSDLLPCYSGKRDAERPSICPADKYYPGRIDLVFVEGHTDNVPIHNGRFRDNWDLSAKRGIVTYQYLLEVEPKLDEIKNQDGEPLFGVSGYADTRPVIPHKVVTPEAQNRRIDLRFILAAPPPMPDREGGTP
jgi:flagellar motor protein MotB